MRTLLALGTLACAVALIAGDASAREQGAALPQLIVFNRDDPWPSLWSIRSDGTQLRRFLRNRQDGHRPALSRDLSQVVFDGSPPGAEPISNFDIQVIRTDGTGLRSVTSGRDWDMDARWTPNGRISFTRMPTGAVWRKSWVWTIGADGRDAKRLFRGEQATWSPDGRKVLFRHWTRTSDGDLFIANADGSNRRQLTRTRLLELTGGWSRDGRKILFSRARRISPNEGDPYDVFVVNADGTGQRKLAPGTACCWSPDGSKILYASPAEQLWVMNANGSGKRRIARVGHVFEPHWS